MDGIPSEARQLWNELLEEPARGIAELETSRIGMGSARHPLAEKWWLCGACGHANLHLIDAKAEPVCPNPGRFPIARWWPTRCRTCRP